MNHRTRGGVRERDGHRSRNKCTVQWADGWLCDARAILVGDIYTGHRIRRTGDVGNSQTGNQIPVLVVPCAGWQRNRLRCSTPVQIYDAALECA